MKTNTLKMAMAAFFHDIGKFADKDTLNISESYMNDNMGVYLPQYKGRYTHYHAVYTAAFIEKMHASLPFELNDPNWGEKDAFINLAAGHHNPETPLQWIVAIADRISSGLDRDHFDDKDISNTHWRNYKKVMLLPVLEQLDPENPPTNDQSDDYAYRYPLQAIHPETVFPQKRAAIEPETQQAAKEQYRQLFDDFCNALVKLKHRQRDLNLWFEHFESLMMIYTSSIPAARAGNVIPDVSLYDHSRMTASLASALYLYHELTNTFDTNSIKDDQTQKLLLVNSDFQGIQNYIFSHSGDSTRHRSKILRGRSFSVSLLTELAADMICRRIGLPFTSVVLNTAGKFTIIAPNTATVKEDVAKVEQAINDWLIKISYGETLIRIDSLEASLADFSKGKFADLWTEVVNRMENKKYSGINMKRYGGVVQDYLNQFSNDLRHPLCPFCGKRPSRKIAENSLYIGEDQSACNLCRDSIFLGANLVKKERLAILLKEDADQDKEKQLFEPLFGIYQVVFPDTDTETSDDEMPWVKLWNLSTTPHKISQSEVTVKFINGYAPFYTKDDGNDPRILCGLKNEDEQRLLAEQIQSQSPKTFNHIACKALTYDADKDAWRGVEALGVLKADIDNLGLLMACGLADTRYTISRMATLSRQLDAFFTVYLPHLLASDPDFNDIYTVFAGGDDLFLIGPWNRIIKLTLELHQRFADFACHNPNIHFSAGITLHKPHTPIDKLAEHAETELERSKINDKNRLTLFSETVTFNELEKLNRIQAKFEQWLDDRVVSRVMFYKLNQFIQMAAREKQLSSEKAIDMQDMSCTKWRAMLSYAAERNIAKRIKGEDRNAFVKGVISDLTRWLEDFGGKLKLPVWTILYNRR